MASDFAVAKVSEILAATYRTSFEPLEPWELERWHRLFHDVDDDALIEAAETWCRDDHEWAPRPGQLRALAGGRTYAAAYHRPFGARALGRDDHGAPMAELVAQVTPRARQSIDEARRALREDQDR